MREALEDAIKALVKKAESDTGDNAMKFTQAALNVAHIIATLKNNPA